MCAQKTSVDNREDPRSTIARESKKIERKKSRDPRVTPCGAPPLIFHWSWENRIDNVSHPDAVRGPHAEGIEARTSHSFVAHRKREGRSKNKVRHRIGGLAVMATVEWFIYRRDNSRAREMASVNAKWVIRAKFTVISSIRMIQ